MMPHGKALPIRSYHPGYIFSDYKAPNPITKESKLENVSLKGDSF
jgi:hypothetical protein